MKRAVWALAGLSALTIIAGFSIRGFLTLGARPNSEEARIVEQEINRHIRALTENFEYSRARPLFQQETFPELELPILQGDAPDWSQSAVVTVGGATSSSALELYTQLTGKGIQKVHVLSGGPYVPQELEAFPTDVTILNGTDGTDSLNIGREVHNLLGIVGTSGYLIDANQTVLFAQVNKGDFTPQFGKGSCKA